MPTDDRAEVTEIALAAASRRGDELLALLRRWVEVNSFTANPSGVDKVGHLIAEALAPLPLTLERRRGDGCGDHLAWTTPAWRDAPARRIVLVGHHDTVFPPGSFEAWDLQGDRLRGPGVLDMKGGLACVRTALAALHEAGLLAGLPLALVSVGDEETGSLDSRTFLEDVARGAAAALVFEAGRVGDQIVVARKGVGTLHVGVHGKAAHAGNDLRHGVNAIWALARFVDAAQRLGDDAGGTTVNVGTMRGGTSTNTVPEHADCAIDFRFVRAADGDALMTRFDAIAREVAEASGARFVLSGGVKRPPQERRDAAVALAARYGACALAEGLGDGEAPLQGGGSDGNTVSAVGVPAIDGLGPRGRGFHTHDEYVEVPTLMMRTRALVRFLAAW
ncbi:MAG: M20 family metallopeptidase [Kofleriaceae bacterium]|nr:M20 family metallopeptidase [Myxococcales bacterium]MCB9570700.1 M20 family metallopeptidase [Kofleriaceae bacterium]